MHNMQIDLDGVATTVPINLVAIGQAGTDGNINGITDGRDIPFLQDDNATDAWGEWGASKYELLIVDSTGTAIALYNLGQNSLGNSANYDEVRQLLIDTANAP